MKNSIVGNRYGRLISTYTQRLTRMVLLYGNANVTVVDYNNCKKKCTTLLVIESICGSLNSETRKINAKEYGFTK